MSFHSLTAFLGNFFKLPWGTHEMLPESTLGFESIACSRNVLLWVGFVVWNMTMDSNWNWSLPLRGHVAFQSTNKTSCHSGKYWLDRSNSLSHFGWHKLRFTMSGMMTWTLRCSVQITQPLTGSRTVWEKFDSQKSTTDPRGWWWIW